MKFLQKTILAALAGSILATSAQAAVIAQPMTPSVYAGAKVGAFLLDEDFDNLTAYGAYAGYKFTPQVGVEAEYVGSSSKTADVAGIDFDYSIKTYGLYGTYQYDFANTNLYAKGKLGLAKVEAKVESSDLEAKGKSSDSGIAGGVGLGYNVTPNVAIEGEYAMIASDADTLTIGASYKF